MEGATRRVGVELEFAGLPADVVAKAVADWCGGRIEQTAPHAHRVVAGDDAYEVYLDMALAHPKAGAEPERIETKLSQVVGDAASIAVPVEIVTPPLAPAALPRLDRLVAMLRAAGAGGTRDSVLYAHGMHLNVEAVEVGAAAIAPVLRAFVLVEDWLRQIMQIDLTRRTFAFVDGFPIGYIDRAAAGDLADGLVADYLAENPTRNRSLDMTPLLALLDREAVERALDGAKLKPRPTYHYRLPDCDLGRPGWTPARDWNLWVHLERIAADAEAVSALAEGWKAHRAKILSSRADWRAEAGAVLAAHGLSWPGAVAEAAR
ncbi:hypothetical protein LNKW23_27750 [Paralimibaculum aggregatum]|uniref:Amidoligase enzyme n=1 Tax=Paralimibaculum aggregatum TaxID=3036245 RepID=A0ABQ6LKQ4_9RHOB|nr:hypothetical protein LNKW23_27750 [Limibaculum sp. NKW23]